jgi:putative membrane protein
MNRVFQIYSTDMKNIVKNWAVSVIIFALIILPSFYAWFNIKASWDPYGRTKGIAVAVTNNDKGATLRGRYLNVGNELIKALKKNQELGWKFVNEEEALHGVKTGHYYASLSIPEDFSEKLMSVLQDEPEKPVIEYTVNEKLNAIAPKMTKTGASTIVENINEEFIKTASKALFTVFNQLGMELERELGTIENVKNFLFFLEAKLPEIHQAVNTAYEDAIQAQSIVGKAQDAIPVVSKLTKDGIQFSNEVSAFLTKSRNALKQSEPTMKQDLITLEQIALAIHDVYNTLQSQPVSLSKLQTDANQLQNRLEMGIDLIDSVTNVLENMNQLSNSQALIPIIAKLQNVKSQFQTEIRLSNEALKLAERGNQPGSALMAQLNNLSEQSSATLSDLIANYDTVVVPAIRNAVSQAIIDSQNANRILKEANESLPDVRKIVDDASKGIQLGIRDISFIQKHLPESERKIRELADKIRNLERNQNIPQIIRLLKKDAEQESDFFKKPVLLQEHKLFPIPNYGSGMSPFYTVLSYWVGAMLLISLLTVEVHNSKSYKSWQVYLGRFLTFWTIAFLQSIVVSLGDLYILHVFSREKTMFVLFSVFIASIFILIVYTLVSLLGNVGKALGIILLVFQISASGGTFPIQVAPVFFQRIHPFLPFTYAISLLREAVGGMVPEIVKKDILILFLYGLLTLVIGMAFKAPLNRLSKSIVQKIKQSQLIH